MCIVRAQVLLEIKRNLIYIYNRVSHKKIYIL